MSETTIETEVNGIVHKITKWLGITEELVHNLILEDQCCSTDDAVRGVLAVKGYRGEYEMEKPYLYCLLWLAKKGVIKEREAYRVCTYFVDRAVDCYNKKNLASKITPEPGGGEGI